MTGCFFLHITLLSESSHERYNGGTVDRGVGCARTFASEAKFEIEAKISFRLEAKKKPDFT